MVLRNLVPFLFLGLVYSAKSQIPNLENVGDILQSLKDSGMMDKFEQDLKQMLFDQKDDVKTGENLDEDLSGASEPPIDVYEFIKAYVTEKKIKLNEKVMLYLMELPIKDDLHVHLARLTGVVDTIAEITKLNKKQVDAKVIDTVKRIKSLSVLKNSLEKLLSEAGETKPEQKTQAPKSETPKAEKSKPEKKTREVKPLKATASDDDITGAVVTFLEMIKARPDQMIDVITTAISAYELVTPQTLKTVTMYAKAVSKSEYFDLLIDSLIGWVEGLGESEIGKQLVEIAPSLIQAKSVGEVVGVLTREFDKHKDGLLELAQDPNTKVVAVEKFASFINAGINYVQLFVKDDMKMTFINTFLLTQGFPSINSRKIVTSSMKLVDKVISVFTPWDVDVKKHEAGLNDFVKAFEDNYVKWSEYYKLPEEEQVKVMVQFIDDNLVDPCALLISAQQFIAKQPECGQSIMCSLNEKMKTESKLKSATTRGLSIMAAWAWSMEGTIDYGKIYEGIWSENCDKKYPDKSCHIFPWQSSLKIDHVEL